MKKLGGIVLILSWLITGCGIKVTLNEAPSAPTPVRVVDFQGAITFIGIDGNIQIVVPGGVTESVTSDASIFAESPDGLITYREPTWSPDSGQLAYVRRQSLPNHGEQFDLLIYDRATGSISTVFSSDTYFPFYLYWAPDGESIGFLTSGDGPDLNLWVTGRTSDAKVIDQGEPYYWTWLSDGSTLFAHIGGSVDSNPEAARLQFVDPVSSPPSRVSFSPLSFQAPALLEQEGQLAVVGRVDQEAEGLYTLSFDGEVLIKVADTEGKVAFDFSPSGQYLAMVSGPDIPGFHVGKLVVMDLGDPQGPRMLPVVDDAVAAFWWSPTEDRLLYLEPWLAPEIDTQSVSFRSQEDATLRFRAQIYDPQVDQSEPLVTFKPTQEFIRVLRYYDQYSRSASLWSPDGSHIVFSAVESENGSGIFVLDVEGKDPPFQVGEGILAYWSGR